MPKLFIISGCNGAGKTTASYTILPDMLKCSNFVNADEIARGLSPFDPESASIQAGRIMLTRVEELLANRQDFAIETTLATRTYINLIRRAQKSGYTVTLLYFWLNMPSLAIERVKLRVESGGHNVSEERIRRRYDMGIKNLFNIYIPECEYWMIIDNSYTPVLICEGGKDITTKIHNKTLFNQLINYERTRISGT
ncbi:MAG: zeta toxin family protein [Bacteroidales bacterium]|jgi:predicted ABC-type ATPase|nr:zeta toxin family protein [Bacteroidales bacterium]MBO7283696.1 zeta toxin family protein [Bacteroidales bacterium]MBO7323753.1 zeta toxin family protein [Bacteroidales bacterium]MBQ1279579.1 zeta toxin family protein [Bacteroidales bacterium]MBQ5881220.1 zeta toxin family protein [Bacteroidales bacterium]